MKIAVNAQFLNKPGTGTGQYFIRLLETLLKIDKENIYILYNEAETPPNPSLGRREIEVRILNTPFYTRDDLIRKTIWEKFIFPKAVEKDKMDLIWSPYFSVSRFPGIRHVMTIHDVIYRIFPQYIPNIRWKIYYALAENAARYADKILTISECSKKDIMKFLRIQEEKVKMIYLGRPEIPLNPHLRKGETDIDSSFKKTSFDSPFEKEGRGILENKKYILYLGGFDYRKNVIKLIEAYKIFCESNNDIDLVIAGKLLKQPNPIAPDVDKKVKGSGLQDRVQFIGYVADENLPELYKNAEVFVFPTLYEGFGLPVLEAMTYGCPVISSNNSSIPEVAGEAALLVNPSNPEDIAKAIEKVLIDEKLRESMIQKGNKNILRFFWDKCAKEILEVFNSLK